MNGAINLRDTPDTLSAVVEEGLHTLTIKSKEKRTASTGSTMITMDYTLDQDESKSLRFDNTVLLTANGSGNRMGLVKIKRILKAIGYNDDQVNSVNSVDIIVKLLKLGSTFQAKLNKNEKGYLELKDINSIESVVTKAPKPKPVQTPEAEETSFIDELLISEDM